jgi:hypothetical protein
VSLAGAKAAVAAQLSNVTWTVPTSAATIPHLGSTTSFAAGSIFTYEAQEEFRAQDFPVARILVPRLAEIRTTAGSDLVAEKLQTLTPQIYVLFAVEKQFSQGGHELLDAILDAILAYFRHNSGGGATPTVADNDKLISIGLRQDATVDPVVVDENAVIDALHFRGCVTPTVQMSLV